jgi:hypothetical protein
MEVISRKLSERIINKNPKRFHAKLFAYESKPSRCSSYIKADVRSIKTFCFGHFSGVRAADTQHNAEKHRDQISKKYHRTGFSERT